MVGTIVSIFVVVRSYVSNTRARQQINSQARVGKDRVTTKRVIETAFNVDPTTAVESNRVPCARYRPANRVDVSAAVQPDSIQIVSERACSVGLCADQVALHDIVLGV